MNIAQKITAIVAEQLDIDPSTVQLDDALTDLGADSLAQIEVVLQVEESFNIDIDDEEIEGIRTVRDAVVLVEKKLARAA